MDKGILIVDDAIFMRRIMTDSLSESGFTCLYEAGDGEEAIRVLKKEAPEIVLLDITMPGRSGLDVLGDILDINPNACVIMCSAIGQEETIKKAVRRGAADYIVKPFKKGQLAKVVRKYI